MAFNRCSIRRLSLLVLCVGLSVACSGGGDPVVEVLGQELSVQFTASSTSATPEVIRLESATIQGETIVLDIVIGGPTTSTDLYSFAFDLVLGDPTVLAYDAGSATLGDALTLEGSQGANVLASQNGDRVVVGVSKTNGGFGNGITSPENTVVSLSFHVLQAGSTSISFDGPPSGGPPVVLDSVGGVLADISFDSAPASITAF